MTRRFRRFTTLPDAMAEALLRVAGELRAAIIKDLLAKVTPQGPLYRAGEGVLDAIDRLAEAVTNEPNHFALRGSRPDDAVRRPTDAGM